MDEFAYFTHFADISFGLFSDGARPSHHGAIATDDKGGHGGGLFDFVRNGAGDGLRDVLFGPIFERSRVAFA